MGNALANGFESLGRLVGTHPIKVIVVVCSIMLACATGFLNLQMETRPDKLWVPQDTPGQRAADDYSANFGGQVRRNACTFVADPVGDSRNLLSKTALVALYKFTMETIPDMQVQAPRAANDSTIATFTFQDLCVEWAPDSCIMTGLFGPFAGNLWPSLAALEADPNPLATINAAYASSADNASFVRNLGLGNVTYDPDTHLITSASAAAFAWLLESRAMSKDGTDSDPPAEQWELAFVNISQFYSQDEAVLPGMQAHPWASRSFSDVFGEVITGDVGLMGGATVMISLYMLFNFGAFDAVKNRVALTSAAVFEISLAVAAGFGVCAAAGLKYGPMHSVAPFLVLGLGCDDCFVLVNAFERTDRKAPLPERAAEALKTSGVSVTVTSVTDVVAFGIGSFTSLPALSSFSMYSASAIAFLWFLQITVFLASVVLDERRQMRNRLDCLCCVRRPSAAGSAGDDGKRASTTSWLSAVLENEYAPRLLGRKGSGVVLLVWAGIVALGIYGTTQMRVEATGVNFVPKDSYARTSLAASSLYFGADPVQVYVVTGEADYFALMDELLALEDRFTDPTFESAPPYIRQSPRPFLQGFWFESFVETLKARIDVPLSPPAIAWATSSSDVNATNGFPLTRTAFYTYLDLFLADAYSGARFVNAVVRANADGTGNITRARVTMEHIVVGDYNNLGLFVEDATESVRAMTRLAEIVDSNLDPGLLAYAFSFRYVTNWESYATIQREMLQNVGLALAAVFVIIGVLLVHPVPALVVFLSVLSTLLGLIGVLWLLGVSIDSVMVVNIVLAIGISVDMAAHLAAGFMHEAADEGRSRRVTKALGNVGVPVLHGAASTFLAVSILGASRSYGEFILYFSLSSVSIKSHGTD